MGALLVQHSIAPSERQRCNWLSRVRWATLLILANSSVNVASAADFHQMGAFSSMPTSSFSNEGKAKNPSVFGSSSAAVSSTAVMLIVPSDSSICNEKRQPLCRDLAASEFHFTSLRFVLPEVRGLSPKSLNVRRNSVSVTYTFR